MDGSWLDLLHLPVGGLLWEDCDSSGADCTNISGATSSTYTVRSSGENHRIRVAVAAGN